LFRRTVEAIIAEENSKRHQVLATALSDQLKAATPGQARVAIPNNGMQPLITERAPERTLDDLVLSTEVRKMFVFKTSETSLAPGPSYTFDFSSPFQCQVRTAQIVAQPLLNRALFLFCSQA
jgi:hypothetical protein